MSGTRERRYSSESGLDDNLLADDESLSQSKTKAFNDRDPYRVEKPDFAHLVPRRLPSGNGTFVLAIDYGTTRTGVAFALNGNIEVIQDWGGNMGNELKVRTAMSYINPQHGQEEWGSGIRDDRVAMVNTKLELEPQSSRLDELDLTLHVLKGVGFLSFDHMIQQGPCPAYSSKAPSDIVRDYLKKIFERTKTEIEAVELSRTPIDIVLTIPVDWSHEAQDAIFKAVRGAGFNKASFPTLRDTILVSEPEAASYYTARHLRDQDRDTIMEGECFVLCDAGGGTVDVVSFQVKKLSPDLVLEKITKAEGDKFGSALIDTAFKTWLRDIIGETHYCKIDPTNEGQQRISAHAAESGPMRELIRRFNVEKHNFSLATGDVRIELPSPLNDLDIMDHIEQGRLTIRKNQMRRLMNTCVTGVLGLINSQIERVGEAQGRSVWNVLLVGGFGASPYLRTKLKQSFDRRQPPIGLRVPDQDAQTTAVVQGAVIYGLEKSRHRDATYLSAITKSYGVLINDKFFWFARKGDLARPKVLTSESFFYSKELAIHSLDEVPIYCYNARSEVDDYVPVTWKKGRNEVTQVATFKFDTANSALSVLFRDRDGGAAFQKASIGPLNWRFTQNIGNTIDVELLHVARSEPLGQVKLKIESDAQIPRATGPPAGGGEQSNGLPMKN